MYFFLSLTWELAMTYLCHREAANIAFNVLLTIPPHLFCFEERKIDVENQ